MQLTCQRRSSLIELVRVRFREMEWPLRLFGLFWVVAGIALIALGLLAQFNVISVDTWPEWVDARIAEVESGDIRSGEELTIEYSVDADSERHVTGVSIKNPTSLGVFTFVPVPVVLGGGLLALLVSALYFVGIGTGRSIHGLNLARVLSVPLILALGLGLLLLLWSWLINADWEMLPTARDLSGDSLWPVPPAGRM